MIQILIPMAGPSVFFQEETFPYPKPLIEIKGIPMIQRVIESFKNISNELKFIFILNQKDCIKFHLDDTIRLLTENNCTIVRLNNPTRGAICSALMAIDVLDKDTPLVISNGDQIIEEKLNSALGYMSDNKFNGGVITFDSVHPKWSYVRIQGEEVVEASEKRPISRDAIAGFYYYQKAIYFIESAFKTLLKDNNQNGVFYISSTINEMILSNLKIGNYKIENKYYHSFYSPQKIQEFEQLK